MGFWSPERGESITEQAATRQGITEVPELLLAPSLDIHLICDAHTCSAADTKPPSLPTNRYPVPKVSNTLHEMFCFCSKGYHLCLLPSLSPAPPPLPNTPHTQFSLLHQYLCESPANAPQERGTEHQHKPLCVELCGLVGEHEESPSNEQNHQQQGHPLQESRHNRDRHLLPFRFTPIITSFLCLCVSCTCTACLPGSALSP